MRIKYFPNVQSENYDQKPFVATIILHVTKYIQNYYHSNSAREHKVRNHLVLCLKFGFATFSLISGP